MITWRLQLRPKSPWGTPLRSDSLFGAICWVWLELFPETFEEMLSSFSPGKDPAFILSDAFPGELLPLPLHIRPPSTERKLKPPIYLSEASFKELVTGSNPSIGEVVERPLDNRSRIQTAIDRALGTAAEGQLFEVDIQTLSQMFDTLSIYIRSDRYLKQVIACFKALGLTGFGKKSSSGLGAFDLVEAPQHCPWLDGVSGANAFVTLSHFVAAATDPTDGRWRLHVTYPKFHGNGVSNVFKGSILMMAPGSVFRLNREAPKPWYGCMVPMPRSEMPKAIHYAIAFAVPVRWQPIE